MPRRYEAFCRFFDHAVRMIPHSP